MLESLRLLIQKLKTERRLAGLDEAATKNGILLPLLSKLGWDTFNIDEVVPEYAVGGKRVDYALRLGNTNKVFIEVKKTSEELGRHQEQLLNYSFQEGVKLAALTNGSTWWFYLPLQEGSWEQRKFYTVDILEQTSEVVASKLMDFLWRENVETGRGLENAETLYRSQQKVKILTETVPDAWNKLVSEADELLIELLSETTEKLCGYKADAEVVEAFLIENKSKLLVGSQQAMQVSGISERKVRRTARVAANAYTAKRPEAFTFRGTKHRVDSWRELLTTLCELLAANHNRDFDKVLSLRGRKRQYFSRNANELWVPRKLENTDIFVEVNFSANSVTRLCFDMLSLFGYSDSDLVIETS